MTLTRVAGPAGLHEVTIPLDSIVTTLGTCKYSRGDPPQLIGPFGSKVVAAVYGGVEWCVPHAMSVQARYCTRMRCLRLLGVWGTIRWFQWHWCTPVAEWLIAPKELLPILLEVAVWGPKWRGRQIVCHCDNMAVVAVVNSGYSRDTTMMHMLRCLFFLVAFFQILIRAVHIAGISNRAADALSRNDLPRFFQVVPEAARAPTPLPHGLLDLLVRECPDWTSPRWAQRFSDCFTRV